MTTWTALRRLVRFTPGLYALTVGLQVARLSLVLAPGLIVRAIFDDLTGHARLASPVDAGLWLLAALLVGAALVRVTTVLVAIFVEITASYASSALLRRNLFAHLLATHAAGATDAAPGELVSRLEADTRLIAEYLRALTLVVGTAVGAALAVVIMARIDPLITAAVLAPLLLAGAVVHLAGGQLGHLRRTRRAADGQISAFLTETFGAAQAIKAHGAEARVVDRLCLLSAGRRRAAVQEVIFRDAILSGLGQTSAIVTGVILLLAGQKLRAGAFTVGDVALFSAYLAPVADFTARFGESLAAYRQVAVSWERLRRLLAGAPPALLVEPGPVVPRRPPPAPPAVIRAETDRLAELAVRGLTRRHPRTGRGIDAVSFTLRRGSVTVITGPVGAGKTTLLRALLGLLPRDAGEIRWNGRPVDDPAAFLVPPRAAYTPQAPRLFSETLRDTILLGLPDEPAQLREALRLSVLERDISALERGLDTPVGPRGVKLSGGQLQRAAAARMLVRAPDLLVCDDLSSALDVETEQILWQRIFALSGVTCLIVSHRQPALRRADQIIVLQEGRVVGQGDWRDLLATCPPFGSIWHGTPADDGRRPARAE